MKRTRGLVLGLLLALVWAGCSGGAAMVGKQTKVEEGGEGGDWTEKEGWEADDKIYYVGILENQADLAAGKRFAKAEAVKSIIERIKMTARGEFKSAFQGSNVSEASIGRYGDDFIGWIVDNIEVSGISSEKFFWERYEVVKPNGLGYTHRIRVLVSIPKEAYKRAVARAYGQLADKARAVNDAKAEQIAKDAMKRLIGDKTQ